MTIIVLGLGNLCALDFQQRSMASKSPRVARFANVSSGLISLTSLAGGVSLRAHARRKPGSTADAPSMHTPLRPPPRRQQTQIAAGFLLLALCVPFTLMAGYVRKYYGPDSPSAVFTADTCSAPLGLPSCAEWKPEDRTAFFMFLYSKFQRVLGGW